MHHNGYKQSFKSHLFLCHSLTSSSDILVIECNVYSQYMRQFSDLLRHTKLLQDTMPLLQISTSKARTHRHAHWRHVVWNTCRVKQQENGTNVLEEILHNFKLVLECNEKVRTSSFTGSVTKKSTADTSCKFGSF